MARADGVTMGCGGLGCTARGAAAGAGRSRYASGGAAAVEGERSGAHRGVGAGMDAEDCGSAGDHPAVPDAKYPLHTGARMCGGDPGISRVCGRGRSLAGRRNAAVPLESASVSVDSAALWRVLSVMSPAAALTKASGRYLLDALAVAALAQPHHGNPFLHFLLGFGLVGIFFVSIVDASFIPLPVPGMTDIMVVVLAAQHTNVFLLVGLTTVGSALGGLFSHKVGRAGGIAFLEKHVKKSIFKRVCDWMNRHAILSVALPAALPPPMPLSPFVLAAGALEMSRRKFMTTFTISRCLRHVAAAAIGIYF